MIIINRPHYLQLFHFTGCLVCVCASSLGCISDAPYPIKHCPVDTRSSAAAKCIGSLLLHPSFAHSSQKPGRLIQPPPTVSGSPPSLSAPSDLFGQSHCRDCLCIFYPSVCLQSLIRLQENDHIYCITNSHLQSHPSDPSI